MAALVLVGATACSRSSSPSTTTSTPTSARPVASTNVRVVPSPEVFARICHWRDETDATSAVYVAYKGRVPHRLVVTPSENMADAGPVIFDVDGNFLGAEHGGDMELELVQQEERRVATLMDGAFTTEARIPCR
ncbi:MAG: hypothetical protein U0414_08560 [Polyangiaceae bacterium]